MLLSSLAGNTAPPTHVILRLANCPFNSFHWLTKMPPSALFSQLLDGTTPSTLALEYCQNTPLSVGKVTSLVPLFWESNPWDFPKLYQISWKLCRHSKELSVLTSNTCMMLCHVHTALKVKIAPIWNLIPFWSSQASLEHGLHSICSLGSIFNQYWVEFLEKWVLDGHYPGLSAHVK